MSTRDKGSAEEVAEFQELSIEGAKAPPCPEEEKKKKMAGLVAHLKENLPPEKYAEAMKFLDLKPEATIEMVLGKLDEVFTLIKKKEYPEYPEKKKGEGIELESYKEFMTKCMKDGKKSMKECAEAYKKQYPEPKSAPKAEEIAEIEKLEKDLAKKPEEYPEEVKKKLADQDVQLQLKTLQDELAAIKDERRLSGIASKVDGLISEKHLSPSQRDNTIKLAAKMPDELREEFLTSFRGQSFVKMFGETGERKSEEPGKPEGISEAARKELYKKHGIDDLIREKGLKRNS